MKHLPRPGAWLSCRYPYHSSLLSARFIGRFSRAIQSGSRTRYLIETMTHTKPYRVISVILSPDLCTPV